MKPFTTQRTRTSCSIRAGKGFGTFSRKAPKQGTTGKNTERKDLDTALSQARRPDRRADVRPIDDREAAQGRVDFAQVTNWGSGNQEKLGELQVQSFTKSFRGDDTRPFYEQLARALELAQNRGRLKVADMGEPFPPFEQWLFKAEHYAQYLADQLVVHQALADACAAARGYSSVESQGAYGQAPWHHAALFCFAVGGSLARAIALLKDVQGYAAAPALTSLSPSAAGFEAGGMAKSYAQYITRLGRDAGSAEASQEREEAGGKLFAHAYCIHATHLTTGMRIGAAATERLGLLQAGAMHLYSDYPDGMTDPLAIFVEHVNQSGIAATQAQRAAISEEVPGGLLKTSLLLAALARNK